MPLIVKSGVREFITAKKSDFRVSEKAWEAMEKAVEGLLMDAVRRAESNGRKTLQAHDL